MPFLHGCLPPYKTAVLCVEPHFLSPRLCSGFCPVTMLVWPGPSQPFLANSSTVCYRASGCRSLLCVSFQGCPSLGVSGLHQAVLGGSLGAEPWLSHVQGLGVFFFSSFLVFGSYPKLCLVIIPDRSWGTKGGIWDQTGFASCKASALIFGTSCLPPHICAY